MKVVVGNRNTRILRNLMLRHDPQSLQTDDHINTVHYKNLSAYSGSYSACPLFDVMSLRPTWIVKSRGGFAMDIAEKKWVYIVDDDPLVRRSVHIWLSARNFEPRSFSGPIDFLEELPNLKPGCALLDVRMPELNGMELVRANRVLLQHFAVIMMTGHGDVEMAVQAMKLGAVDFIEKPFKQEHLVRVLEFASDRLLSHMSKVYKTESAGLLISSLTNREVDVLGGLLAGLSNKSLAHELGLSPRTVEMHRSNVMKKLRTRTLSETLKLAMDAGFP